MVKVGVRMGVGMVFPHTQKTSLTCLVFSERGTYVHVRYMLSAVRLLSVCNVGAPYSAGFWQFFHHTIAQRL